LSVFSLKDLFCGSCHGVASSPNLARSIPVPPAINDSLESDIMKFSLKDKKILKPVYRFTKAKKVRLYLVGGILRDLIMGRVKENPDFDFAMKRGAINFGRNLARQIKAGFVVLDKEHGACRIVKRINDKTCTFDFTDFRAQTLEKDLLLRDFTIDAIALELEKVFLSVDLSDQLIDPHNGRQDLNSKVIRIVSKNSFRDDPLRILRAFSLASIFGLNIDKQTLKSARIERQKLSKVSSERIRDELFKIFATKNAFDFFGQLDRLRILEIIFPEIKKMRGIGQGPYHHLDAWQHTLETMKQFEELLRDLRNNKEIQAYLEEVISADRKRGALIKLAAFLHDIGKPKTLRHEKGRTTFHGHERVGKNMTEEIARRLRLSNEEVNALQRVVLWHLRPGYLADTGKPSARAKFRFLRDAGSEAISTLLISIADQRATKGPLTTNASRAQHEKVVFGIIREYYRKKKEKKMPRLINGDELIKRFKLGPSPLIGKMLAEIEELQAIGRIKTKKEAYDAAAKFIKK